VNLLINVTDLSIASTETQLLEPLSFKLYQDRPITILGQTGSGKSLLAQAIMGLLPSELSMQGKVETFGQVQDAASLKSLWGTDMVMLPQEPWHALDPLMPAYQQIAEVHQYVHRASERTAFDCAMAALAKVGLKSSAFKRPGQLSGGMAQRLAVSAATAGGAKLILADEPTKGLDISRRNDIISLLKTASQGGGLLTITHDIEVARQLAGDIIVMKQGQVVEQGSAEQVLQQPQHPYTQALIAADPRHWDKWQPVQGTKPILQVSNLAIGRNNNSLAKDINFTLHAGEVMGVVGDSGCGKSTLGDTLLGLLSPIAGQVTKQVEQKKSHRWLKLFQDPPAAFTSSVTLGTLLDDLIKRHKLDPKKAVPLMEKLKLAPQLLTRRSTSVSGGELQRFAILRALMLDPVFLFADEPTSRLDPIIAQEITELLINLAREQGCALLMVSHDPNLIAKRCDSVIELGH